MKINQKKFCLFFLITGSMLISSCKKPDILIHADGRALISPARKIAGTWKSFSPINVYEITNCNNSAVYTYSTFKSNFTFVITTIDDNNFDINISLTSKSGLSDACGQSPPIEDSFPLSWTGQISSSGLTFIDFITTKNSSGAIVTGKFYVGGFTMTTNILSGTIYWLQYYSSSDCIGWKTDKITLTKQ